MGTGLFSAIGRLGSILAPEIIFIEKQNKNNLLTPFFRRIWTFLDPEIIFLIGELIII